MAFTKITAAGIGSTETVTLDGVAVINNESIGGNLTVTGNATIGGVLTYEDVTNVDSIGIITARAGVVVGSGITLSKDGDGFFTGVCTATSFVGDGSALTGITQTTINNNADNRLITGSDTANTLNGESNVNIASGILIAGHTASTTVSDGEGPFIQVKSTDSRGGISLLRHSDNAASGGVYIAKSRNGTIGSNTIVQSGDELGRITFSGDDGTNIHSQAAAIHAFVDGTPGENDMPGRLQFYTTADGAASPTERLRIDSSGSVGVNVSNPAKLMHVSGSYAAPTGGFGSSVYSVISNSGAANNNCGLSINAGNNGVSFVQLGDTDDANVGTIEYVNFEGKRVVRKYEKKS